MSDSENSKLFGGKVVLELAHGAPSQKPPETDWVRFMPGTSKGMDLNLNSVTSDADDQDGFVETIVTTADLTISFDGEVRKSDALNEMGFHKMLSYIVDCITKSKQPSIWVRFWQGDSLLTAFMVVTKFSTNGGTNELHTCSAEFKVSAGKTVSIKLGN